MQGTTTIVNRQIYYVPPSEVERMDNLGKTNLLVEILEAFDNLKAVCGVGSAHADERDEAFTKFQILATHYQLRFGAAELVKNMNGAGRKYEK